MQISTMHEHRHTELTDGRVGTAADTSAFHFTCTVHPCTISVTGKSPFEMYASEVQTHALVHHIYSLHHCAHSHDF